MKRQKGRDPFKDMKSFGVGMVGVGLSAGVGAGVQAQMPAGTPNMMGGFATMGSMMPMMGTAVGAGTVLGQLKKMNKKK